MFQRDCARRICRWTGAHVLECEGTCFTLKTNPSECADYPKSTSVTLVISITFLKFILNFIFHILQVLDLQNCVITTAVVKQGSEKVSSWRQARILVFTSQYFSNYLWELLSLRKPSLLPASTAPTIRWGDRRGLQLHHHFLPQYESTAPNCFDPGSHVQCHQNCSH